MKGSDLAGLLAVPAARPIAYDVADQQIVAGKVGGRGLPEGGPRAAGDAQPAVRRARPDAEDDRRRPVRVRWPDRPPPTPDPDHAVTRPTGSLPELERLVAVMGRLRQDCPWDAQQTHRSLVQYLIEETCEMVEAIETGDQDHLREELGDLLLQVIFHAEIAGEAEDGFDRRGRAPAGSPTSWSPATRTSSPAAEVPERPELHLGAAQGGREGPNLGAAGHPRAAVRAGPGEQDHQPGSRSRRVELDLPDEPITAEQVGAADARAGRPGPRPHGIDPDQAVRDADTPAGTPGGRGRVRCSLSQLSLLAEDHARS